MELSRDWMKQDVIDGVLYVDGHVKIYYGRSIEMPKRYVSQMRLCFSGSTDYQVNGAIGQPYFVVHKTINEGMIKTITEDIIPELGSAVKFKSQPVSVNAYLKMDMKMDKHSLWR